MNSENIFLHFNCIEPYYKFCREEQNFVAILYNLLLSDSNNICNMLDIFHVQYTSVEILNYELYVEYSFIRDLWSQFTAKDFSKKTEHNKLKKEFILNYIKNRKIRLDKNLETYSIEKFNQYFGCNSKTHIQSPSNWNVKAMKENIYDVYQLKEDFKILCKFKWSFNIKPDLVLKLSPEKYICVEAKLESSESSYPSAPSEKKIWNSIFGDKLHRVKQFELQLFMFSEIIGIKNVYLFVIDKKGLKQNHKSWKKLFSNLTIEKPYVKRFVSLNKYI